MSFRRLVVSCRVNQSGLTKQSQRQENIMVLLDLLNNHDFYSRLYSLQLLSAISSARLERTQECILSSPLGTSRLVAILDDPRDAVRSGAFRNI